jgi:hypothetical protein
MNFFRRPQPKRLPDGPDLDRLAFPLHQALRVTGMPPATFQALIDQGAFKLPATREQVNVADMLTLRHVRHLAIMQELIDQGVPLPAAHVAAGQFDRHEHIEGIGTGLHFYHGSTLLLVRRTKRTSKGEGTYTSRIVHAFLPKGDLMVRAERPDGSLKHYLDLTHLEKRLRRRLGISTKLQRLPRQARIRKPGEPFTLLVPG